MEGWVVRYRVAVYADDLGQWVHVGPLFASRDEAARFLDTFATPFKRLVQVPVAESQDDAGQTSLEGLDHHKLEFVRFLIETGRLSEDESAPRRGVPAVEKVA